MFALYSSELNQRSKSFQSVLPFNMESQFNSQRGEKIRSLTVIRLHCGDSKEIEKQIAEPIHLKF